jgi:hypothetical protein
MYFFPPPHPNDSSPKIPVLHIPLVARFNLQIPTQRKKNFMFFLAVRKD